MKIGIFTLYDLANYGNRLQNYAVSKTLNRMDGVTAETLVVYPIFKRNIKKMMQKVKIITSDNEMICVKKEKFKKFTERNIPTKILYRCFDNVSKRIDKEYDYFVAGSDQIWNPTYGTGLKKYFLLDFAETKKKIFIAASFGLEYIPDKLQSLFYKNLKDCNFISVREENAVKMLEEIEIKNSISVLDPVFLLTKEEWGEIEKEVEGINKTNYILTYFLSSKSQESKKEIEEFAMKNNCSVISLNDVSDFEKYTYGPEEFLHLFRNAKLVITDSFHGTSFSAIYNVPFITMTRKDKISETNSRMISLLNKLELENRIDMNLNEDVWKCDFNKANQIIKEEVYKMNCFLKKSLRVE